MSVVSPIYNRPTYGMANTYDDAHTLVSVALLKWYFYDRQNVNRDASQEDGSAVRKSIKLANKNKHTNLCIADNADDKAPFGKHLVYQTKMNLSMLFD